MISIIIPFYNVEGYVRNCLDSVLSQSYSDYEVVCVDDGSTDSTGSILDEYDGRGHVLVFHKTNGGLSDARNYGVSKSSGDYICFVDGDDYVSPSYLTILAAAQQGAHDRVSCAGLKRVAEGESEVEWPRVSESTVFDVKEAMKLVCYDAVPECAFAKLYPREVILNNPYPLGRYFEDLAAIGGILSSVSEVAVADAPVYASVQRGDSIAHSIYKADKKVSDYLYALDRFSIAVEKMQLGDDDSLAYRRALVFMRMRPLLRSMGNEGYRLLKEQQGYMRQMLPCYLADEGIRPSAKARVFTAALWPFLHDRLLALYKAI